ERLVAALEHDVVEVDRRLADGRNVHDPGGRALDQAGEEHPGEQVAGQVVDGEVQLVAVLAEPPFPAALQPDPGVVDEHVEPVVVPGGRAGEGADRGERGEVRGVEAGAAPAIAPDLSDEGGAPLPVPTVDDDVRARGGDAEGDLTAEPVRRAGDQD